METNPKNFIAKVTQNLKEAISFDDFNIALKGFDEIEEALKNGGNEFSADERNILNRISVGFKWVAFVNIDEEECLDLIQNHLDAAFEIPEFALEEKLSKRVVLLMLEELQIKFMEKMLRALEANTMPLGDSKNSGQAQTLGALLKEFLTFPSQAGMKTNLDEIKFLNQSKAAQRLGSGAKDILLEVLKIYDLIKNSVTEYHSRPQAADDNEFLKGFNLYKWLPGLDTEGSSANFQTAPVVKAERPALPVVPRPQNSPAAAPRPIREIEPLVAVAQPKPVSPIKLPALNLPQVGAVAIKPVLSKPLNIQDIIKAAKAEQQSAPKSSTSDIDKKLDELKQRAR